MKGVSELVDDLDVHFLYIDCASFGVVVSVFARVRDEMSVVFGGDENGAGEGARGVGVVECDPGKDVAVYDTFRKAGGVEGVGRFPGGELVEHEVQIFGDRQVDDGV